jgi:hypothetical protein
MKKTLTTLSAALLTALVLTACGGGGDSGGPPLVVDAEGVSTFDSTVLGTTLTALPNETLSPAEQATLVYMREEEKLAHDVYVYLATLWGGRVQTFANIATSEATHTEAVRQLLLRYNLADPAASLGAGQFQNATLQALYTQLVAAGAPSLVDALKVGAAIEEIDMVDIQAALVSVDKQDIRLVYENLLKGSRNHLRAFVKALLQQGVTYVPQYMNPADYLAIINTPVERN